MKTGNIKEEHRFSQKIAEKEKQKLKSQREGKYNALSGFALFGMVGWSVVVPTLLGIASGVWLDKKYPQSFSWTISLLFVGLFIGCIIAWQWVDKENKKMNQNKNKNE
jgi:ATP synthase protein I